MAAVNRYTQLSTSQFDPLSLQELMLVPAMKRKEHDDLLAKQELIRAGLAKVDPLDVHFDEAVKLKQGLESQMDATATDLAKNGINPDMTAKVIALNRQYNDLVSPTGRIGQINAAKVAEATAKKQFMDSADKKIPADVLERAWQEHRSKYTGYDTPEKTNIRNIENIGAVGYQDIEQDMLRGKQLLGSTTDTKLSGGNYHFENRPEMGGFVMVSQDGKTVTTTNDKQLQSYLQDMNTKWLQPTGEGRKYADFAKVDLNNILSRINNSAGMMRDYKQLKDLNTSNQFHNYPKSDESGNKNETEPTSVFDPESTTTIENEINNTNFGEIGTSYGNTSTFTSGSATAGMIPGSGGGATVNIRVKTYKDVLSPLMQSSFEMTSNKLKQDGKLPKDFNPLKATPSQSKLIGDYIKSNAKTFTVGNDIVQADISPSEDLFMGPLSSKPNNERTATIKADLDSGAREIINPETNKPFTKDEWRKSGYKIDYYGYDNPLNYRGYNFGNKFDQQIMAHKVNLYDKDGNSLGLATVSRTPQEMQKAQFKASYNITHSYRNALNNVGKWINTVNSGGGQHKQGKGEPINDIEGLHVKYNENGTFSLKKGNSKPLENLTPAQFEQVMYDLMLNK